MDTLLLKLSDVLLEEEIGDERIADLGKLLGDLCINRTSGIAYHNIRRFPKLKVSKDFLWTLDAVYQSNCFRNQQTKMYFKELSKMFAGVDFHYAVLKGTILSMNRYQEGCRVSNDIDVLVDEYHVEQCTRILRANGFVQGTYRRGIGIIPATRREIILSKLNYGETVPFFKLFGEEAMMVDVNFSLDYKPELTGNLVERMLQHVEPVLLDGCQCMTLEKYDFLIHLCCHLYKEATTFYWVDLQRDLMLYKFSDINLLLRTAFSPQELEELATRIQEYGLERECYYTFVNSSILFPPIQQVQGFKKLIDCIQPNDLSFMKQIIHPKEKTVYEYKESFLDWFFTPNRRERLHEIKIEGNKEEGVWSI